MKRFRRGKSRLPLTLKLTLVSVALASLAGLAFFVWFVSQDFFWTFMYFTKFNATKKVTVAGTPSVEQRDGDPSNGDSSGLDGISGSYGSDGINLMYINKMSAGMHKEYLQLAQNICNWNYMDPTIEVPQGSGSVPKHFPIFGVLGGSYMESGWKSNYKIPVTELPLDLYGKKEGATFSLANANWFRATGTTPAYGGMNCKEGGYYSQFQFDSRIGITPAGSVGGSAKPATISGYGFSSNAKRTGNVSDASYLPDAMAVYLQSSYIRLSGIADVADMTLEAIAGGSYAAHNGGAGLIQNTWSVGGFPSLSASDYPAATANAQFPAGNSWFNKMNPTTTKQMCAAESLNIMSDMATDLTNGYSKSSGGVSFSLQDTWYYEGMFSMYLLKYKGGFLTSNSLAALKTNTQKVDSAFMQGARDAVRLKEGNPSYSTADALSYFNSLGSKTIDTSFYGAPYIAKTYSGGRREITIFTYSSKLQAKNAQGAAARPVLHAFTSEAGRGFIGSVFSGKAIYHQMLLAAGVEVTLEDAIKDTQGAAISQIKDPVTGDSNNPSDSWYYGTKKFVKPFVEDLRMSSWIYCRSYLGSRGLHRGEDWGTKPVNLRAMTDAIVESVLWDPSGYGNYVTFRAVDPTSKETYKFMYAHLGTRASKGKDSKEDIGKGVLVKVGQTVKAGDVVAVSGNTGNGVFHLHWEMEVTKGDQRYQLPSWGICSNMVSVAKSPRLLRASKSSPGVVYRPDWTVYPKTVSDVSNHGHFSSMEDYRKYGLGAFIDMK